MSRPGEDHRGLSSQGGFVCFPALLLQSAVWVWVPVALALTAPLLALSPSGAPPRLPLAGGECVWKSGRRHDRLEPAASELAHQRVQRCGGVSEPRVGALSPQPPCPRPAAACFSTEGFLQGANDEAGV